MAMAAGTAAGSIGPSTSMGWRSGARKKTSVPAAGSSVTLGCQDSGASRVVPVIDAMSFTAPCRLNRRGNFPPGGRPPLAGQTNAVEE
jgi:hypothetical protein